MEKVKFYQKKWFAIIMLIFLAPIGIFLIWKYNHFSKRTNVILSIVFIIWFIYILVDSQPTEEEKRIEEAKQEQQEQQEKQEQLEKEESAKEKAKEEKAKAEEEAKEKEAEKKEREEKEKKQEEKEKEKEKKKKEEAKKKETKEKKSTEDILMEKGLADSIDSYEGELTIEHEPGTMWSENSLMRVVYDMLDNLPIAFKDDKVDSVVNAISVEMVDNKGNEEVKQVITYRYTREDYEALNYDKFKQMSLGEEWRILNEADGYFIHPGIRANLKDKYTENLY